MLRLTRRTFCGQVALLGLGGYAGLGTGCRSRVTGATLAASDAGALSLHTFSQETFATLSAVCERLLPRDRDPGAIDLGVPSYIDRMLASPELAAVRAMLLRVLPIVDRESRKRYGGKPYHEASPDEQDAILTLWQNGHDGGQAFFPVILSLTLEGAFGDPKYGGNAGGRGFAMIGFTPDPPLSKMAHVHSSPSRAPGGPAEPGQ
jgi:gluconate 2-dehydrogenase gamma chain